MDAEDAEELAFLTKPEKKRRRRQVAPHPT
jgi:hypothetical protein